MTSDRGLPVPVLTVGVRPLASRLEACEPVTTGVPFPAGAVRDVRHIALRDEHDMPVTVQVLPLGAIASAMLAPRRASRAN